MKTINLSDLEIEVIAEYETMQLEGNAIDSGDAEFDAEVISKIQDDLNSGNVWAWASVEVKATYKGLTASDYLGGCSYGSEDDFRSDGYFDDMCQTVLDDIINQAKEMINSLLTDNELIMLEYPIQDAQWPSRRWNKEQTEYMDLSGE